MNYDSLLELVIKRRSIRKLKPDPIPDELVDNIIEVARWAPSGANSQPWEFIVIKKQELRDRIIELINEQNSLMGKIEVVREPELRFKRSLLVDTRAPVFIIVCGDTRTVDAYPLATALQRGHSHFVSGLANAFLYMSLAGTALGLGTQWVSAIAHHYVQSFIKDLLGVPKEIEFYDMLAVGYPDMEPKPRFVRAREEIVHYDYYDKAKFRTDVEVKDFIGTISRARKS